MLRPPKGSLQELDLEEEEEEEEEEPYYGEDLTSRHDSSSERVLCKTGEMGKVVGKKGNTDMPRSKHSETEQRRRSKINERFLVLRDLIPQNDQKRDKASFLLEVIEFIQFLQQKLQMYEGAYHGYNQEPTKLTPWRNNSGTVDGRVEPSQVVRNGTSHENNVLVNLEMLAAAQNSLQPDIENAVPMQMQSDMFASDERVGISGIIQEPVGNMASHPQPQLWSAVPFAADYSVPNTSQNQHEQQDIENGSGSLSRAYSQGLLSTLTQALRNSGVDLSQASISVQIDVGKRASPGTAATLSSSKGHINQPSSQTAAHGGDGSYGEESNDEQPHKRLRTENS